MKALNKFLPWIILAIAVVLLSLCFYRNQLNVADYEWFMNWQDDSDLHIRGRISRTIETQNPFSDYALIGQYAEIDGELKYDPYFRQIGIQGLYASLIQRITGANLEDTVRYTRMLNAILCAVMCGIFAFWCCKEFGTAISAVCVALFAFSPWLTVSARNLYWAMWLMLLPSILALLMLRRDEQHKKYSHIASFFAMAAAIFLKCGAGYEFVSCVLVCMEIPYIYYALKNKWGVKKFLVRAVTVGVGGVLGFAAAVALNLLQCTLLVGDFDTALRLFIENISKRTGAFGIEQTNELIIASLNVSPLTVINTYLFSGEPVLFSFTMSEIIAFFLIMLCVAIYTKKGSRAAYIASAVSLVGPISWMVLAKGHSYIHCHINYVLWSLPSVYIMALCGVGTLLSLIKARLHSCNGDKEKVAALAIPVLLVLYIVVCFYARGNVRGW